ncbi:hypothetical protein C7S17_6946 [Burkholderia thailandensis]|nr:hypothetical protein [Burkholderia thailandensis]
MFHLGSPGFGEEGGAGGDEAGRTRRPGDRFPAGAAGRRRSGDSCDGVGRQRAPCPSVPAARLAWFVSG